MKGINMNRKHYFKLADYLGTFEFHMQDNLKDMHYQIKEDLFQELTNLVDNIKVLCKEDNRLFDEDKFQDEIGNVLQKRKKEYKEEQQKEYDEETSEYEKENLKLMDMEDGTRRL